MDIPATWCAALAAIKVVSPDAVIAGGCLRDLDNGRAVKDIDIFVSDRGARAVGLYSLLNQLRDAGFDCAEIDPSKMYPVGDGNDLIGCIDMEVDGCPPVQVVMVDWPIESILERFDYGICRISFDGEILRRHSDYEADQNARLFKLRRRREGAELDASVHRYARLCRKYEGWNFHHYEEDDVDGLFDF